MPKAFHLLGVEFTAGKKNNILNMFFSGLQPYNVGITVKDMKVKGGALKREKGRESVRGSC